MHYCFLKKNKSNKKYYFTGTGFDTVPFKMKKYRSLSSLRRDINKIISQIPADYNIYHEKVGAKKPVKKRAKSRKKNPVPKSKWNKLKEASKRYEDFSGHQAKFIDEKDLRKLDVGFKIGTVDFIGYTTKRDGRVEKYIHKFKAKSRPILASNYDGKFISLVNGKYEFTNRGIVDK
jgi:N-acetyl-anhydromuramyl-L-alanine amidase AmpD